MVLQGSVSERVAGRVIECARDRMLVRPAGVVHSNAYGRSGADCVILGARAPWIEHDEIARAVFAEPRLTPARIASALLLRLRRELRIGDDASRLAIEGLILEIVASTSRDFGEPHRWSAPAWVHAVRAQLHDAYALPVRLHAIARDVGVHPVHLTRAFRRAFGCSPGEYIRERRIERACADLSESDRSIAEIALVAGFASASHFATAFRRATGMSPRAYRAAACAPRRF